MRIPIIIICVDTHWQMVNGKNTWRPNSLPPGMVSISASPTNIRSLNSNQIGWVSLAHRSLASPGSRLHYVLSFWNAWSECDYVFSIRMISFFFNLLTLWSQSIRQMLLKISTSQQTHSSLLCENGIHLDLSPSLSYPFLWNRNNKIIIVKRPSFDNKIVHNQSTVHSNWLSHTL